MIIAAQGLARRAFSASSATATPVLEYASSCVIPTDWVELPLLHREERGSNATVYDFGLGHLPGSPSELALPTCACLLLQGGAEDVVRPYTPIPTPDAAGSGAPDASFRLLVKRYDEGVASRYLHGLKVNDSVKFKHISFNIKEQYPFEGKRSFTMLCGGTGITPIYQAVAAILSTPGDLRPVTVLYGNTSADNVLLLDELRALEAADHSGRLKVVHVLGTEPGATDASAVEDARSSSLGPEADAGRVVGGWVDHGKIAAHGFAPAEDTMVFVCGLPGMYDALCGPRGESGVAEGTALHALGYTDTMVAKM